MCFTDIEYKALLVIFYTIFVISISFLCLCQSSHVNLIPCNVSWSESCPASLYYAPKTPKTVEETASLFNVKSDAVNITVDGLLIAINCSCLSDHDEYTWHMDYTVQRGDTWEKISSKFGSFVVEKPDKALIASHIVTLDVVCGCSKSSNLMTYKVETGDTLFTICSRFKADANKTAKLNGLENADLIHAGDVIFIPAPGKRNLTVTWLLMY